MSEKTNAVVIPKEVEERAEESEKFLVNFKNYSIKSHDGYVKSVDIIRDAKSRWNKLETDRKKLVAPINESKSRLQAYFNRPLDFLMDVQNIVRKQISIWETKQEQIRRKKEAELAAIARIKAEKLEAKAEAQRDKGNVEKAEELEEQATETALVQPTVEVKKVAGASFRTDYKGIVLDIDELVKAVAAGTAPANLIIADESAINKLAAATKNSIKVPGIKFYSKKVPVIR